MTLPLYKEILINSLKKYNNNSRTHSKEQVQQVVNSIKEFGFTNPILIDENNQIIAGHCRLEAAKIIGIETVPCIVLSHLSESQKKAYVIADNKLALNADWDISMLQKEFEALKLDDFNLELTGFNLEELIDIFPHEEPEVFCDEDDCPDAPDDPIAKLGDVWLLGEHRLMCGDSTSIDAVEKLMNGVKVDMVFTDPPYGMFLDTDYDSMFIKDSKHRKTGKRFEEVKGDHEDFAPELINNIFACFNDVKEIFIWGADYFSELIPNRKDGSWVVWDKRCDEKMDKVTGNTFELCWSKQKHKRLIARILWSGHHGMQKDDTKTRVHPTQKPTKIIEWFFDNWGKELLSVVDLFGGSGSTLIACEKTQRKCFMMELDPRYIDVIVKRYENYTGKKAILENNNG